MAAEIYETPWGAFEISGELSQVVHITLPRQGACWASNGGLLSYDEGIQWHLKIPGGGSGAVRRIFAGEGISLTYVTCHRDGGRLCLSANDPGHVAAWDLSDGPVTTTRGAFLGAIGNVEIDVTVARRAGAAFFGGAGLFLQTVRGRGLVFVHGAGDFIDRQLNPGERIMVSTGNLAAFSDRVDYNIRGVGGCGKILFSKEGLFMTELSGPGRVLLQTLKRRYRAQHAQ